MRVVLRIELDIDTEEYTIPADGRLSDAMEEDFKAALWDYNGIEVKRVKVLSPCE